MMNFIVFGSLIIFVVVVIIWEIYKIVTKIITKIKVEATLEYLEAHGYDLNKWKKQDY